MYILRFAVNGDDVQYSPRYDIADVHLSTT